MCRETPTATYKGTIAATIDAFYATTDMFKLELQQLVQKIGLACQAWLLAGSLSAEAFYCCVKFLVNLPLRSIGSILPVSFYKLPIIGRLIYARTGNVDVLRASTEELFCPSVPAPRDVLAVANSLKIFEFEVEASPQPSGMISILDTQDINGFASTEEERAPLLPHDSTGNATGVDALLGTTATTPAGSATPLPAVKAGFTSLPQQDFINEQPKAQAIPQSGNVLPFPKSNRRPSPQSQNSSGTSSNGSKEPASRANTAFTQELAAAAKEVIISHEY